MVHLMSQSKLPKKFIIMDFFLLVELEIKLIIFTATHWNTTTLKMKKWNKKKKIQKFLNLKWKFKICKFHFDM